MESNNKIRVHPIIKKCMKHLDILETDDKTKQIVYMYMETLHRELVQREKDRVAGE
ncbi:hypothetical protein [Pseudoneobacillus sp. C159]